MAISIQVNGQQLQLFADSGVTHRRTNPIFTKQGSYSYPITVPATPYNLALLQHPEMLDRATAYKFAPAALIDAYSRRIAGTFNFDKVDKKNGVSFNVDSYEGDFWADANKRQLADIDWGEERMVGDGTILAWSDHFRSIAISNPTSAASDYTIFPIVVAKSENEMQLINKTNLETNWQDYGAFADDYHKNIQAWADAKWSFSAAQGSAYPSNRLKYSLYSVAPFLFLTTVIRYIAAHYKFSIERNDIAAMPYLNRIAMLHNTVDAYSRTGSVYKLGYKYLVPTVSVAEFINSVANKFMLQFFFDYDAKTINIISLANVRTCKPTKDLTPYLVSPIVSMDEERKMRVAKNDNSSSETKTLTEFYSDFLARYPDITFGTPPTTGAPTGKIYFYKQDFYMQKTVMNEDKTAYIVDGMEKISSAFFFTGSGDVDVEVMESKDVSMQCVPVAQNFEIYFWYGHNYECVIVELFSVCPFFDCGGVRQQRNYGLVLKNATDTCPLAFTHVNPCELEDVPRIITGTTINNELCMLYANVPLYQGQSNFTTLYSVFHKPVLDWLNASCYPYEATLRVPPHILNDLKPWEPFMLGNQAYLFEDIKEQYSTKGVLPQVFKLRSVKMLEQE